MFISLFILLSTLTNAQTLFKGKVKDSKTNESLIGVTITLKNTTTGTVTNLDGIYQLHNCCVLKLF